MDLNILWFILITVLYVGFFILEGFDFGVGILLPFLGKDDKTRRMIINTIGPHWDGNEVWLLTAGGASFAAFPHWYATMFSGFYLPLFLLLVALIIRGVAFEFRSKDDNPLWRKTWDWAIFVGSLLPPLLLGVAFANLVKGVPINADMTYTGGFFNLLNLYALIAGLTSVVVFTVYGALFLSLKTEGNLHTNTVSLIKKLGPVSALFIIILTIATYMSTDITAQLGINPGMIPIGAALAILAAGAFFNQKRQGWAFTMTAVAIALTVVSLFQILFPRVMVSSTNPDFSLTIYNASSSPYTLKVMTIIALTLVPFVLIYQGWSYWVFRQRITEKSVLEY
ncbi:MAG: cytochrome d ubiquinol oxidase subunit II [Ardenticatenaceae bacterium]|nr:cytochrome d ubiquinol oxidase subunit II [Ardenticatenaceae bacterium]MCB9003534.1 cytochrome d ubiquinol oxidase subunit II [Ardenticatenaceae bacterium]